MWNAISATWATMRILTVTSVTATHPGPRTIFVTSTQGSAFARRTTPGTDVTNVPLASTPTRSVYVSVYSVVIQLTAHLGLHTAKII